MGGEFRRPSGVVVGVAVFHRQMRVAHPGRLTDPLLATRPGRPVGADVAIDAGPAGGGFVETLHHEGHQTRVGSQVAGVDQVHPGTGGPAGQLVPSPLDQPPVAQIPPGHRHPVMTERGEHRRRFEHRRAGDPAEADVDERRARPLPYEPGRLEGIAVGVRVRGAAGHHEQGEGGPARLQHRFAQQLHGQSGHPERAAEPHVELGMTGARLQDQGGDVALGMAGTQQHQRQHGHRLAAPLGQPPHDRPRRRFGHLQDTDVHRHLGEGGGDVAGQGGHLVAAARRAGTMTYEDETVEGCHLPGQANRFAPGAPGEAPWRVAVLGPRLVIAGPASGVGKTTVATGILAALARRGDRPAGAKVGPDFIDPGYHAVACGRPPRNLDAWLCGADAVRPLAARAAADAGMLVVEGVMGLFDGAADGEVSSTADVSRLLDAPVVLVVDASAMSGSVAALVHGYSTFDPELRVGGVILNRVGSDGHEALLREALDGLAVPVLGALRRDDALTWRDRHLGLVPVAEQPGEVRGALDRLAAGVAAGVDLEAVVALARSAPAHRTGPVLLPPPGPPVSVGVAGGPAFTFTYTDTIEALEAAGARVVAFDPLADGRLPGGLDGLVIG